MIYTKSFKKISKDDVRIAGGKGASLGEMSQANISVPPGFVVLSQAFEKLLKKTNLDVEIDSVLSSVDQDEMHTVEDASEKIENLILEADVPEEINKEIDKSFKELDANFVAVRSSATAEDSANTAWAGQLESFLNTTKDNLLENVKKCWASLFTPRAIFYRFENNLDTTDISVAVVVQKMIESKVSGVSFSVHPVTQDKNQLVIEASFGLGEAVVSGKVTPDSYVVKKDLLQIVDKNISTQSKGLYKKQGGGNEWKDIPEEKGEKQVSSDDKIKELAKIIIAIEDHYGFPVDVEWAYESNEFYIVQSRPITTINNKLPSNQGVFNYIKRQKWFFGVRVDESLLSCSAKTGSYDYIKKEYGTNFAETIFIQPKKDHPIRVLNSSQAKDFHAVSRAKIFKDPKILLAYINKNNAIYKKIDSLGEKLLSSIKKDNYDNSVNLFNEIFSLYEIASAQSIIIFSLGFKLTKNINELNNVDTVVKSHNKWRNSVIFKEKAMGKNLFHFFKYLSKKKKTGINPSLLIKFLTINEVNDWIENKLIDEMVQQKIDFRKKHGFIYLNFKNYDGEVIDNLEEIEKIREYFFKLYRKTKQTGSKGVICGYAAYTPKDKKPIRGETVIIKDRSELKTKNDLIDGKVLITTQTTPHFIPYIKKAKAIITDEGGITCHAAIASRELKIPCIIGANGATSTFNDGDGVELDVDNGVVKIIEKNE